jgi:hypothetical protein
VTHHDWVQEFPGAITVCDPEGTILEMNDEAIRTFAKDGGEKLIGTNVLDCHPGDARAKLQRLMETRQVNVYTIEKRGVKKLIYQAPWYEEGTYRGFLELALELPAEIPNFIRQG